MLFLRSFLPPLITFLVLLFLWDYAAQATGQSYLLPRPHDVLIALIDGYITYGTLWEHFMVTTTQTLLGFALGCGIAVVVGSLVAEFSLVDRMIYPFVIALQSMPKVAFAPLLIVWFGFGMSSKVVLVALICFFPMFVNMVVGLRGTPVELLDLYKAFSASRLRSFIEIKVPSALPSFFAGLQISIVFALLGSVVGEFVASQKGLGSVIQAASVSFKLPIVFACIISLSVLGAAMTLSLRAIQRRIVFWQGEARSGEQA